jgi:urea transport system substrate-binding protein
LSETAHKITAADIPVCNFLVGEDDLRGLTDADTQGHLAAWSYFQTIPTPENRKFVKRFQDKYGKDQVVSDPIETAYFQVYLWKLAVEKAKSTDVDKVREAIRDLEFDAPGGKVRVDGKNYHTWKPFRMGRIRKDGQLETVYVAKEWIRPEPYPALAFRMDCDWIKAPGKGVIDRPDAKEIPG